MLSIKIPNFCRNEQYYIVDLINREFLGISCNLETYNGDLIEISMSEGNKNYKYLTLDTSFFQQAKSNWLKKKSLQPVIRPISIKLKESYPILK